MVIRTPEGIGFSLLLAGPFVRFLAWIIDTACIVAATTCVMTVLRLFTIVSLDFGTALATLANFLVSIGYAMALEWFWNGQTLGKRMMRLRVMDANGLHLRFGQVVIRNLLRVADGIPLLYMAGGVTCLASRLYQRFGDIAAGTIVIRSPEIFLPNLERLAVDKYNSLREHPHLASRLRQKVSREEAAVALQAVMRREELEPGARNELFREMSEHFKGLVRFPQEALDGVSDERYVRNVVEIIYNRKTPGLNQLP
jgi:uncharacterized RDD family membrane protein YckC